MYHLLKAENTEVESYFLKSTINIESNHYEYWLVNKAVCCLGLLRLVGACLHPCKTLLNISVNYPISSPCNAFYAVQ